MNLQYLDEQIDAGRKIPPLSEDQWRALKMDASGKIQWYQGGVRGNYRGINLTLMSNLTITEHK